MVKISEHFSKRQLHKMVDVKISHVYSPEEFWVQRCDRNGSLGALEEEMFKFYENEDNKKSIEEMPFPGSMLACKYRPGRKTEAPSWIRGLVLRPAKPHAFFIFYVDYGTEEEVYFKNAKNLDTKFTVLPYQAIRARLSGIQPKSGVGFPWPKQATKFLKEKADTTYNLGGMVARLDGFCQTALGYKASLRMIDTVTNDLPGGIVLNDVLVEKGLALRDNLVYINDSKHFDSKVKLGKLETVMPSVPMRLPQCLPAVKKVLQTFHSEKFK